MMLHDFKINGTAIIKFSEDMLDESKGFNISMLNDGLMNLTVELSEESKNSDMLIKTNRTIEELTRLRWNATMFEKNELRLDVIFDYPLFFS